MRRLVEQILYVIACLAFFKLNQHTLTVTLLGEFGLQITKTGKKLSKLHQPFSLECLQIHICILFKIIITMSGIHLLSNCHFKRRSFLSCLICTVILTEASLPSKLWLFLVFRLLLISRRQYGINEKQLFYCLFVVLEILTHSWFLRQADTWLRSIWVGVEKGMSVPHLRSGVLIAQYPSLWLCDESERKGKVAGFFNQPCLSLDSYHVVFWKIALWLPTVKS